MTTTIYDFPNEWYDWMASPLKYRLLSINQSSARIASGAQSIKGPHAQLLQASGTFRPLYEAEWQSVDAFFARLRGRANAVRFAHPNKLTPLYNRTITPTITYFSDGTRFSDDTGFANGLLPPTVYVATAAVKGDRYIVLKGFPASTADIISRGDPLEIVPNGVPATFPHRYEAMYGGSSNSSGEVGFAIEPGLHASVAVGDPVKLDNAASVFRLTSDDAVDPEFVGGRYANISFSLVEAVDLVP